MTEVGSEAPSRFGGASQVSPKKKGGLKKGGMGTKGGLEAGLDPSVKDKLAKVKRAPPKSYVIQMPDLMTENFEDVVHGVVWRVGRSFGFQAFNLNPKTASMVSMQGRHVCMHACREGGDGGIHKPNLLGNMHNSFDRFHHPLSGEPEV